MVLLVVNVIKRGPRNMKLLELCVELDSVEKCVCMIVVNFTYSQKLS